MDANTSPDVSQESRNENAMEPGSIQSPTPSPLSFSRQIFSDFLQAGEMRAHFVDALRDGTRPDLSPETAIKALQLAFAVYQASNEQRAVDPASIDGRVSPHGWPPPPEKMKRDVEEMMARESAREARTRP